jgi:hypothetical protein
MSQLEVMVTQFDEHDPLIAEFQTAVFADHGLKLSRLQHINNLNQWNDIIRLLPDGKSYHDAYRWLPYKIKNKLHTCVTLVNGKPANITFTETHGEFLRVSVNNYTLRSHRTTVRDPVWNKQWGYFGRILAASPDVLGHFASYHAWNAKLAALVKLLRKPQRTTGLLGDASNYLREFSVVGDPIVFNSVPQHIAYRNNTTEDHRLTLMQLLQQPVTTSGSND